MVEKNIDREQIKAYGESIEDEAQAAAASASLATGEPQERYYTYMLRRMREEDAKGQFTVTVEQDGEDIILPLPTELMNQVGWDIGDTLLFEESFKGCWTMTKKSEG